MILADFRQLQQASNRNKGKKHNQNHSKKASSISQSRMSLINQTVPKKQQKTVYSYMSQLGIGNVEEFYSQEQKEKQKQHLKREKQTKQKSFQQSIQRLYTTGLNKTMNGKNRNGSNHEENESQGDQHDQQGNEEKQHEQEHYYNQLYSQEEGFYQKFKLRMIETQCLKIKEKLFNRFTNKYSIWVAQNEQDQKIKTSLQSTLKPTHPHFKSTILLSSYVTQYFIRSLLTFILKNEKIPKTQPLETHELFFTLYSDYINKFKLKTWQSPVESKEFDQKTYDLLKSVGRKLPFVYWLLDFVKLEKVEEVQFKDLKDVEKWISDRFGKQRQWEMIYQVFQESLNPKFTVPYQTKLYEVRQPLQKKLEPEQEDQNLNTVKASPIPVSTYTKPQQRPQSEKKPPTQPIPFNFTETHSNVPKVTADQLYSWNRNFKAKPIPKTMYQPQLMGVNQKEKELAKKAHNQKLYHEAKFPKTMGYLNNYGEVQELKRKELEEKYIANKTQERPKPKPIPDFEKIHHQQRNILEKKKEINRSNTQPKPFNFTQTKKSNMKSTLKETIIFENQIKQESQKKKKKRINQDTSMPEAKSTAKFDAYVRMRMQQKEEKKAEHKQKEDMKKRKQEDMKVYKEILKQRMHHELVNQPKAIQYNNFGGGNNQNIVKIDLQEIYLQRPLLMEGTTNDKKGKKQDDQKTCFTDAFEPII